MRLQKIKRAMTTKSVYIVTEDGGNQWMGDGKAFYLVDSGLDLTEGNALAILDIDEDKRRDYAVREIESRHMPMLDMCPQEACDVELRPVVSVSWAGELLTIMVTADGEAAAVPQRQIAPADGKEPLRFFLRRSVDPDTGEFRQPVVAAFADMLCCAVIMPVPAETMREVWTLMRNGCGEALVYCVEPEPEDDGSGVGQAFSPD